MTRRRFYAAAIPVAALVLVTTPSCSSSHPDTPATGTATSSTQPPAPPNEVSGLALPDRAVEVAVGELDGLVDSLMRESGIPGMAVAVVHGGKTVYSKGFGVREAGRAERVDADTVFQLASVSKSLAATVVAHQVGAGAVTWETPVVSKLPWFALKDPNVSATVTVGDLFSHRSGLPDHAGDRLEDLGYDRRQVLERLRMEPLDPFRITYHYTNFGLTAAAEAVATGAGVEWAQLSRDTVYAPLGMNSTSSRYEDYRNRPNRAVGHTSVDGRWVSGAVRDADAQAPAGGASSSVNDMARWLRMLLADGTVDGATIAPPQALLPALTPQIVSAPPAAPQARAGFYGYGYNVSSTSAARVTYSHSGAFALGAATNFLVIPSADVAIVALTNAAPIGVPETLTAEFADLVQYGKVREDWRALYRAAFASMDDPEGALVAVTPPTAPAPPKPLAAYAGTYGNDYWGPATVTETDGALTLTLGPTARTYPLRHWDGDTFTFTLSGENAPPGTISQARFTDDTVTLEYFDEEGLGTFRR
ncbi:serine hydrolase [Nocardia bovistercoris]|uniref:Serine hydrolase n=1 Tax=Nocardia bovistercoris TaxID=2785916 RepID=A0A931IF66_9NOCA|nr:serine hydrolase [Nocardia bovistercoris]MBH0780146.1 serine hydrolase [Nocardia bovistercoris]